MKKYRKRPVVIEAVQVWPKVIVEIMAWISVGGGKVTYASGAAPRLDIHTMEGVMSALEGWWVIRGVEGEFYPCAPSIFEQTYEEVS